jgi:hypothetical protein
MGRHRRGRSRHLPTVRLYRFSAKRPSRLCGGITAGSSFVTWASMGRNLRWRRRRGTGSGRKSVSPDRRTDGGMVHALERNADRLHDAPLELRLDRDTQGVPVNNNDGGAPRRAAEVRRGRRHCAGTSWLCKRAASACRWPRTGWAGCWPRPGPSDRRSARLTGLFYCPV